MKFLLYSYSRRSSSLQVRLHLNLGTIEMKENSPARAGIRTLHEAGIRENALTHHIHCPFLPINMARIKQLLLEAWNPNPPSLM